eukprot:UN1614
MTNRRAKRINLRSTPSRCLAPKDISAGRRLPLNKGSKRIRLPPKGAGRSLVEKVVAVLVEVEADSIPITLLGECHRIRRVLVHHHCKVRDILGPSTGAVDALHRLVVGVRNGPVVARDSVLSTRPAAVMVRDGLREPPASVLLLAGRAAERVHLLRDVTAIAEALGALELWENQDLATLEGVQAGALVERQGFLLLHFLRHGWEPHHLSDSQGP